MISSLWSSSQKSNPGDVASSTSEGDFCSSFGRSFGEGIGFGEGVIADFFIFFVFSLVVFWLQILNLKMSFIFSWVFIFIY